MLPSSQMIFFLQYSVVNSCWQIHVVGRFHNVSQANITWRWYFRKLNMFHNINDNDWIDAVHNEQSSEHCRMRLHCTLCCYTRLMKWLLQDLKKPTLAFGRQTKRWYKLIWIVFSWNWYNSLKTTFGPSEHGPTLWPQLYDWSIRSSYTRLI